MCSCPIPGGTRASHCAGCHETFSSLSAFDKHQILDGDGSVVCREPDACGLVQSTRTGLPVWGFPSDPDSRVWGTRETDEQGSPGLSGRPHDFAGVSGPIPGDRS